MGAKLGSDAFVAVSTAVGHAHARELLSALGCSVPNEIIDFVDRAPQNARHEAQAVHAL
jgi:hypothetical protein